MLVVPVISVDAILFSLSQTELQSSDQEASPSPGENTRVVLVPCPTWKCVPTAISGGVDISEVPGCHLLQQMGSQ